MPSQPASPPRRRKRSTAPARDRSSDNATDPKDGPSAPIENLTPQRKHHKLLKDGSEVWSKEVEKIFVQGLHKYWDSPWATYSRGRSRWRNQFLVDHLKNAGIERSKKQVASHIQVLRNMWRGGPEFHLVAGGEELFQENGLFYTGDQAAASSSSTAGSSSPSTRRRATSSDRAESSSSVSSPHTRPTSLLQDSELSADAHSNPLPGSSDLGSLSCSPMQSTLTFDSSSSLSFIQDASNELHYLSSPSTSALGSPSVKLEPLTLEAPLTTLDPFSSADLPFHSPLISSISVPTQLQHPLLSNPSVSMPPPPPILAPNRVRSVHFWAPGMAPCTLDVDHLTVAPARVLLHVRVALPQHGGITTGVSLQRRWTATAKCQTKGWAAQRVCITQELGPISEVCTDLGIGTPNFMTEVGGERAFAYLPESALSRCQWTDRTQVITQQLAFDNHVLAVLVYHLQRGAPAPAVTLMGCQTFPYHRSGARAASIPPVHHQHHHSLSPARGDFASFSPPTSPAYSFASAGGMDFSVPDYSATGPSVAGMFPPPRRASYSGAAPPLQQQQQHHAYFSAAPYAAYGGY